MSEKREYRWEDPAEIYVPTFMNNRELNPAYVESLEDSMRKDGFLPTFPITVFRRLDLPYFDDFTSNLFVVACGVHRTTAAQNISLAKVYVDLRTGTIDDFIEAMHTDNFKFDPTVDASVGQVFTKKEKREACKQLLLLPKYLKLTNVALAEIWHTSEGNIRRWREEIASSIDEDPNSVDFCTQERLAEIKEILKSPVRENVAGDVVHIRSREHGRDDKWDYYRSIQRKVEQVDGLDWYKCIVPYCQQVYEVQGTQPDLSYSLSMQQLTELDVLISEKDKDFLERCRKYGEAARQLETARETCHKVYNECKQEFDNLMLLPESSYDDAYKKCFQSFGRAISRNCGRNLLAAAPNRDTVAKYEQETELLKQLLKDIHTPAEYVQKFHDRYWKRRKKAREELEQEIIEAQHQMLDRVQEKYPGIDLFKFCLTVDSKSFWLEPGDTPSTPMQRSDIDAEKDDKKLGYILQHYQDILKDIDEDAKWIVKLVSAEETEVSPVADKQDSELLRAQERAITRRQRMWSYFASEIQVKYGKTIQEVSEEDFAKAAAVALGLDTIRVDKVGLEGVEYCFGADEFILGDIENPPYSLSDCSLADAAMWASRFDLIAIALMNMADWVKTLLEVESEVSPAEDEPDMNALWDAFNKRYPKWKAKYAESGYKENDLIQASTEAEMLDALRVYRETESERKGKQPTGSLPYSPSDRKGMPTADEVKDMTDLMSQQSYPFARCLRDLLRAKGISDWTQQYQQTLESVQKFKEKLKAFGAPDDLVDDSLHFYQGIEETELSTRPQETLKQLNEFLQGFIEKPLPEWPEWIRHQVPEGDAAGFPGIDIHAMRNTLSSLLQSLGIDDMHCGNLQESLGGDLLDVFLQYEELPTAKEQLIALLNTADAILSEMIP